MLDLRDGCRYELHPGQVMTTASVFKIEVLAGVLLRAQQQHRGLTGWEATRIAPMIRESANPPTNDLFTSLGGVAGVARLHATFGLDETRTPTGTWGLTQTTARDQVDLLRQVLVDGGPLDAGSRQRAWDEMSAVVPSQRWGVTEAVPAGWPVALKNGFAPSPHDGWRLNSAGKVGDAWLAVVLTDGWPSEAAGIEGNRFVNRTIAATLARTPVSDDAATIVPGALGRPATWDEHHHAVAALHAGVSPTDLARYLVAVAERATIARLYLAGLGRAPDPAGWSAQTAAGVHAAAAGIAAAVDAPEHWQFVQTVFERALGRQPDDRSWYDASRSRAEALLGIATSPEHVQRSRARVDALVAQLVADITP
ncbi:MAG TPA: hypothetical protein VEA78_13850 [Acidimicrobiales bacterium]|nr:hypothetical protein [Acidimicrobiales bacterium]